MNVRVHPSVKLATIAFWAMRNGFILKRHPDGYVYITNR